MERNLRKVTLAASANCVCGAVFDRLVTAEWPLAINREGRSTGRSSADAHERCGRRASPLPAGRNRHGGRCRRHRGRRLPRCEPGTMVKLDDGLMHVCQ
jgi:hypothetical protein